MADVFKALRHGITPDFTKWFSKSFDECLGDLRNQSSVGYSGMYRYGPTIGEALKFDGVKYDATQVSIFKMMVLQKMTDMFEGNYEAQPIKVFVKAEPHKQAKADEGRYRLIMAVALEDAMIDRMLYSPILRACIRNWEKLPVKIGYSPLKGQYLKPSAEFPMHSLSIDKQGWDFTVPAWLVDIWDRFLKDTVCGRQSWWDKIHDCRFEALFAEHCLYQFKDGTQATQKYPGIMKSGSFNTILLNSVGQYIISLLAWRRSGNEKTVMWCLGDDTVEEPPLKLTAYLSEMEKMGFVLKQAEMNRYVDFCGFVMNARGIIPAYWKKHLFSLLNEGGEHWLEKLNVYRFLYAFEPNMLSFLSDLYYYKTGEYPIDGYYLRADWRGLVT